MHSARTAMTNDLSTEIKITASADGVEAGVGRAKRSIADLAQAAATAGEQGGKSMQKIGAGGEAAARTMDGVTKNMVSSLQRQIAALESGGTATRQYQESIARLRGANLDTLKPYLDQLDAARVKAEAAAHSQAGLTSRLGALGGVADVVRGQILALGSSLTMGAMFAFVKRINDGVDALNDIKDATGSTIENISALEDTALRTGASLDLVGSVLIKFNDVLSKATPGSDMALALESIGLKAEELRRLDPAEALRQTAVALSGFADDANKARLIQGLFGKSVKDAAPFLADLAEKGALVGTVLASQADEADRFNKQLFEMQAHATNAARAIAGPLVEGINGAIKAFRDGSAAGEGFWETAWKRYQQNVYRLHGMPESQPQSAGSASGASAAPEAPVASKPAVKYDADAADAKKRKEQEAAAAAKQAAEALRRELAEQAKIMAELHGLSGGFADDWARLSRMYADGALSLDQLTQAQAELLAKQPAIRAAQEAEKRVLEDMAKATLEAAKAREGYIASLQAGAEKLLADVHAQQEAADRMGLSRQAVAELDAAKLEMLATDRELQASKELDRNLDLQAYEALMAQAKAYRELANAKRTGAARETAVEEAKKAADEWQRTSDQINQSLTDALMRGFESGKDFAQNLRDTVVNMFKTMVLRPVISAIISPISGALLGGMGLSTAAQAGQGVNGVSTAISGASLLGRLGAFGGGMSAGFGGLMGSLGLSATGSTLGGAISAGGIALGSGNILGGLGTLAGALGPIAIGFSLLASLIKKSTPHMGAGVTYSAEHGLTFGASQYNRGNYGFGAASEYSRAAESTVSAVARGIATALDSTARTFGRQAGFEISTAFADDASKDGAWGQFAIRRNGQTILDWRDGQTDRWAPRVFSDGEAGVQEYQRAVAQSMREALDKMDLPGWASDMLDALGDSPSIENLGATLDQINAGQTALEQLGDSIVGFAALSGDALDALVKASGGVEALVSSAGFFFQNFYSAGERVDIASRQVSEAMQELGLAMPSTAAEYRAMVEAYMAMGEEGAETLAALLQLAPAFASITQAVQSTTAALEQQRSEAFSGLERAVSAQKRVLQSQLQAAQEVAGALDGLFSLLHDNVRELYGEVESTRAQQAAQASQFIAAAVATALASGYLPDSDQLSEAIAAARGGLDASNYGGDSAERDYAALVLAGQLAELEDVAGKQLTDAQRTVAELERQTEQLDQTLDYWRQQIEIANGTYTGVLSVSAAIDRLSGVLGGGANGAPGGPAYIGSSGDVMPQEYRDRGTVPRADYGADVALSSFDKFKAWYQGYAANANTAALQSSGYQVPDWMRVSHAPATDEDMFGTYLFFRNNPQYAADFEQIMTTGRSSMPTDGSTLVRSDLSKMPTDAAEFFANDRNSLLSYEAMGLDPVLGYRLYKDGPEQFGLNIRREEFTEWLRTHKWTPDGIVESNNTLDTARPYDGYKLPRWDTSTGTVVDLNGNIYSPDGRLLGTASRDMMANIYGSAFVDSMGSNYGDATHSALYNSQVTDSDSQAAFYSGIKDKYDAAIAGGQSAQDLADEIARSGASMADVAAAYGISVAVLEENLRNGGATNIPKFDVGTNYVPRDMLAYIHEGEAVVPKAYNPALNNGGPRDSARLEALIEKLTAEVAELKAAANATADNTGKSANVLVAVQRGNSLSQVAEPTF